MRAEIDGTQICSEAEFHSAIARVLPFPSYYGRNLNALQEVLTEMIDEPVVLVWKSSSASMRAMPAGFRRIVEVLREAERDDEAEGYKSHFQLRLE